MRAPLPAVNFAAWTAARPHVVESSYWIALVALILAKAVWVSDLTVEIVYAPHDDSLYVMRALHLLNGEAFGPYDSHTLSKLPGMSLWLAAVRTLGVPHLLAIDALYVMAGLYFLGALGRCGVARWLRIAIFAIYIFNPLTTGVDWLRVMREPLSTGLFVVMLAAMLHLVIAVTQRARIWHHLLVLSPAFAFALLVREDDKLLWAALLFIVAILARIVWVQRGGGHIAWRGVIAVLVFPAVTAWVCSYAARSYVEDHYGLPLLHDMSEGEFPRLLAAIRGIESPTDNRLVMVPQEKLQRLRGLVPEFAPVIDHLPPVGPGTFSCRLQGVCSEWSNGWMAFWIKDSAAEAGLTPDLKAGQQYFRTVRERIEAACRTDGLKCRDAGSGLLPPFELRWSRAYVEESSRLLGMAFSPDPHTVVEPTVLYNVSVKIAHAFQAVTMTRYANTLSQTSAKDAPTRRPYRNVLAEWRRPWEKQFRPLAAVLIALGIAAVVCRWVLYPDVPPTPLLWIATLFFAYTALRIAALSYVATFFGNFDPRIVFASYTGAILIAPIAIAELVNARRTLRAKAA